MLLLGSRQLNTLIPVPSGDATPLPFDDVDDSRDVGELRSALPPDYVDSEHVVWVGGPQGAMMSGAVAGMIASRGRNVNERLKERTRQQKRNG